jgi:hypothetical protein
MALAMVQVSNCRIASRVAGGSGCTEVAAGTSLGVKRDSAIFRRWTAEECLQKAMPLLDPMVLGGPVERTYPESVILVQTMPYSALEAIRPLRKVAVEAFIHGKACAQYCR